MRRVRARSWRRRNQKLPVRVNMYGVVPKLPRPPSSSEITPEEAYKNRREFLKNAGLFAATASGLGGGLLLLLGSGRSSKSKGLAQAPSTPLLAGSSAKPTYRLDEPLTPYEDVTS